METITENITLDEKTMLDKYRNEQFLKEARVMHSSHSMTQSGACCDALVSYKEIK